MSTKTLSAVIGLMMTGFGLTACVGTTLDPTAGTKVGYYALRGQPLTLHAIKEQEGTKEQCRLWAKETNPNPEKQGIIMAVNHGKAGFAGGALGAITEYKILDVAAGPSVPVAIGAATGISAAFQTKESGTESGYIVIFNANKTCRRDFVTGLVDVAPSTVARIKAGKPDPTYYGAPLHEGPPGTHE